jgi:hypothetical protein
MQIPLAGSTRNQLILILGVSILYGLFWQSRLLGRSLSQSGAIEGAQGDFLPPSNKYDLFHFSRSVESNASQLRNVSFAHDNSSKVKLHDRKVGSSVSTTRSPEHENAREPPFRKWAYAFLIGGCSSVNLEYRGFLYNVIAATQKLRMSGSKADVVVFLQMSVGSKETSLPEEEEKLLAAMNIKFHYLPKFVASIHQVFYALVMEKFRILDMTNYSRVLFVDADIMPLCSLDYIFELSEPENGPAVLKENVVLAWRREAANAGFFMLQPNREDYLELQDIILRKEQKALDLPWPHWDPVEGWGHEITAPDFWRSPDRVIGTNWTWHAVFADQGLLYHWTKYVKQSVSLIIGKEIENWTSKNGVAYLEGTMQGILNNYTCITKRGGPSSPYRDFKHFTGKSFLFMFSMKRPCLLFT